MCSEEVDSWQNLDGEIDQGQALSIFNNDKQFVVKSGLKKAFDTLPPRPRVAENNVYSVQEIRALFRDWFNANRQQIECRANPAILNFMNSPLGDDLDFPIYCRCQLNKVLKKLLVYPPV